MRPGNGNKSGMPPLDGLLSPAANSGSAQSISRGPSASDGRQLKQLKPALTKMRAAEPVFRSVISTICGGISYRELVFVRPLSVVRRPL